MSPIAVQIASKNTCANGLKVRSGKKLNGIYSIVCFMPTEDEAQPISSESLNTETIEMVGCFDIKMKAYLRISVRNCKTFQLQPFMPA